MEGAASEPEFRWEVEAAQIDLDHWARSYVALRVQAKKDAQALAWWFWPLWVVLVVALGILVSPTIAVALPASAVLAFIGARLWNQGAAKRLARRLGRIPAAHEPFTFVADHTGTRSTSASGSDQFAWTRYKAVTLHEDLVVLTQDSGAMRLLPVSGLRSGQAPESVVEVITRWLSAPSRP